MRFISEATQPDGHPVIHALGVTRVRGGFQCEIIYVSPAPGVDETHTPIPAGSIPCLFWPNSDTDPVNVTINWPGLTTGVPLGTRGHENIFITEETQ